LARAGNCFLSPLAHFWACSLTPTESAASLSSLSLSAFPMCLALRLHSLSASAVKKINTGVSQAEKGTSAVDQDFYFPFLALSASDKKRRFYEKPTLYPSCFDNLVAGDGGSGSDDQRKG
jgi:hypothetical protein